MRGTFVRALGDIAATDDRVVLLTADLGFSVIEPFAERFPDRFLNVGVAEQNMLGVATGLAEGGFIPFAYSIVTFASLRPFEFIRNGPVLHGFPVRIVAIGGGFEYGHAGPTHHGVEDVGAMRLLEGMTVVAPADHRQAESALRATWDLDGPVYYRLGKDDASQIDGLDGRFELGRATIVRGGRDALLITMGSVANHAVDAADILADSGVDAGVMVVASVSPPPTQDLAEAVASVRLAVTVEAHNVTGGVGTMVAEVIAESGASCRLVRCGVQGGRGEPGGSEAFLLERHGLLGEQVATATMKGLADLSA